MAHDSTTLKKPVELASIASYQRSIHASLERIWENVLDWEHLPWLHASAFAGIRLLRADEGGWRAMVKLAPEHGGTDSEVDVALDRDNLRYITRTGGDSMDATEIVTVLDPVEAHETRIDVDFRIPARSVGQADGLGAYYRRVYARLWDEDEAMMVARERYVARRREAAPLKVSGADRDPIPLGPASELRARLPLLVEAAGGTFRLVEHDGRLLAHAANCPHRGGSLDAVPIEDGCVRCPWHGYRFDVNSGLSTEGRALRLDPPPRVHVDEASGEASLRWG